MRGKPTVGQKEACNMARKAMRHEFELRDVDMASCMSAIRMDEEQTSGDH